MNPKFMLDTNICIYLMKQQPPQVRARFDACFVGEVVISAITLAELEFGIACSAPAAHVGNRLALDSLLEDMLVAPFEAKAARAYGCRGRNSRLCSRQRRPSGSAASRGERLGVAH